MESVAPSLQDLPRRWPTHTQAVLQDLGVQVGPCLPAFSLPIPTFASILSSLPFWFRTLVRKNLRDIQGQMTIYISTT